jgi:protein-L-isoaspartate(D-aspartate) O-methyltransferase
MIPDNFEQARFNMVEQQIRPWEVLDQRVLGLMGELPRDAFVPDAYKGLAYADIEIPLGNGQQMMFPRIEGRLLQALDLQPTDKVLEIGTGCGFLTACLARQADRVVSLEIDAELSARAGENLEAHGIDNAELRIADALSDEIDGGPFDAIAVTGSLPEIPESLKSLLAVGGRLFIITGKAPVMEANLVTRVNEDAWRTESLFETEITPLTCPPAEEAFVF